MSQETTDVSAGHEVELAVRRLDSLSMLPAVAARFLSQLTEAKHWSLVLVETIESDPALAARVLSLIGRQGTGSANAIVSIRQALDKLPIHTVRDAFFSLDVFQDLGTNYSPTRPDVLLKEGLTLHALAVACCAEAIAEAASVQIDSQTAYLAGLLHDIGKLALGQAMPKSFARIFEYAKLQGASLCTIEQKYLGIDHTILGKRLAGKWNLPEQITLAIWLHHSRSALITGAMPEAIIAQIVQLADLIARQCGIGQSGSYDRPDLPQEVLDCLAITDRQAQQIRSNLPEAVARRSELLGLDSANAEALYCNTLHTASARLARDNTKLSLENRRLQTVSGGFDFAADFLSSVNSAAEVVEVAENFAARWQKFYQTGPVCLYLAAPGRGQFIEAVVVEGGGRSRPVSLMAPEQASVIPGELTDSFAILDVDDRIDWLFEQLGVEFALSRTKLVPLLSAGRAVGVIVFEIRHPAGTENLEARFRPIASIGAAVLDMALNWRRQRHLAEQFARLVGVSGPGLPQSFSAGSFAGLTEMAAGAAHELNNPLSVISGRAQLLSETETDPGKKQLLKQIIENAGQISQIIDDLMGFARPKQPRPARTNIKQMLDEAGELAAQKTNLQQLDIKLDVNDNSRDLFVDSGQIVSAIANIFSNAVESYADGAGPVKVVAEEDGAGDFVKVEITDFGCGMDADTLEKATQPFFCSQPAGRKRGMGLAYALRLIKLNGGTLDIASRPGNGTTVTISLPCK
jgi:putative nucleotidyltransferase with HDIG domain